MSLSFVSLNARGLSCNIKRKALFVFTKNLKTDFVFFQESHSTVQDVNFWRSQWGNAIWASHASEHSAGVCTLLNHFSGGILHSDSDPMGHYLLLVIEFNSQCSKIILLNFYGYNSKSDNESLLDCVEERLLVWLGKYPDSLIIMGGHFNTVLDNTLDRWPPRLPTSRNYLNEFMDRFELVDIWREYFLLKYHIHGKTKQAHINLFLIFFSFQLIY